MAYVPQEASPDDPRAKRTEQSVDLMDQDKTPEDAARNKHNDAEMNLENWILSAFGEEKSGDKRYMIGIMGIQTFRRSGNSCKLKTWPQRIDESKSIVHSLHKHKIVWGCDG